ncbi:MAG: PrgI family protein [Patescibacteria group bacterium]
MRFHVPQFIEKENKIIGPLTLRQFLWLLIGGGLFLIVKIFLSGMPLIIALVVIAALSLAMAYARINDVSLPRYTLMAFNFLIMGKRYTYTKEENENITWQKK